MELENRRLAVIGCGRVGLPLSLAFAAKGVDVLGVDLDPNIRDAVNLRRQMPFHEPGFEDVLASGRLQIVGNVSEAKDRNAYVITVGSPLTGNLEADTTALDNVARALAPMLRSDDLVVLRSTLAVGLGSYLRTKLERLSGLAVGKDLSVAYCPERIVEGAAFEELATLPQVIGADDAKSMDAATQLFAVLGARTFPSSIGEAELVKLFCNAGRYAQFAVANSLFVIAETLGVDPFRVFHMANTDYPRAVPAKPGFTAGTCLRKDFGLLTEGMFEGSFLLSAWHLHENMPKFVVDMAKARTGSLAGRRVGVLGLAFKRDTDDVRDSLALKLCRILQREKVLELVTHDPFVPEDTLPSDIARRVDSAAAVVEQCDVTFVAANHSLYAEQADSLAEAASARGGIIVDVWNNLGMGSVIDGRDAKRRAKRA